MQSIATYTTSTRVPAQRRAAQATLATSGCIATRSVPTKRTISQRACCTKLSGQATPKPRCSTLVLHCTVCPAFDTDILHNLCTTSAESTPGCSVNFNDSVKAVVTRNSLLHHLHRGGDDWLVSGHGDAFADRRHRSGGSRAHRIDKEQPISRPTCRRRLMLFHTCGHKGMCRRLCTASPAAWWVCVGMCACHVFPGMQQPRVPRCATSHPARYPMACATCVRWRRKIGRVAVTDGRARV